VSRYTKIAIDQATGRLKFTVAKGHYGVFTCDVQYGNKVVVVHYTVKKSTSAPASCVA
jgi:ribosomal protein L13